MNQEQVKSGVRWLITAFGASVAGYIAGKIGTKTGDVLNVLNSDVVAQAVTFVVLSLISLVWSMISKTEKNVAAAADRMPNVAGVITKDTEAGQDLAKAVPSSTVTVAGSAKAATIAKAK